jgi:hypothetical protein
MAGASTRISGASAKSDPSLVYLPVDLRAACISICIGSKCAALLLGGSSHHAYDNYLLFCAETCVCTVDTRSGRGRLIVESRSTSLPQFVAYSYYRLCFLMSEFHFSAYPFVW